MQSDNEQSEFSCSSKSRSSATWITLITALGVTATALIVAKRLRSKSVVAHAEDLVDLCDRAAKALDERLNRDLVFATR